MKKRLVLLIAILLMLSACSKKEAPKPASENASPIADELKDSVNKREEKKEKEKPARGKKDDREKEEEKPKKDEEFIFENSKMAIVTTEDEILMLSSNFDEYRKIKGIPLEEINFYNTTEAAIDDDNNLLFMTYGMPQAEEVFEDPICSLAVGDLNTQGDINMQKIISNVNCIFDIYRGKIFYSGKKGGLLEYDIEKKEYKIIEKEPCFQTVFKEDIVYYVLDFGQGEKTGLYAYDLKNGEKEKLSLDGEFVTALYDEYSDDKIVVYSEDSYDIIIRDRISGEELLRCPQNHFISFSPDIGGYFARIREDQDKGNILQTLIHDITMGDLDHIKDMKEPKAEDFATDEEFYKANDEYIRNENIIFAKERYDEYLEEELESTPYFETDLYYLAPDGEESLVEKNVELQRVAVFGNGMIGINRGCEKQLRESDVYSLDSIIYGLLDYEVKPEALTIIDKGKVLGEMDIELPCNKGDYDEFNELYYVHISDTYNMKIDIYDKNFKKLTNENMHVQEVRTRFNGDIVLTEYDQEEEVSRAYILNKNKLEKLFEIDTSIFYDLFTEREDLIRFTSIYEFEQNEIIEYDMKSKNISRQDGMIKRDLGENNYYELLNYLEEENINGVPYLDIILKDKNGEHSFIATQAYLYDGNIKSMEFDYAKPCLYSGVSMGR
ncbi:MAG: hypothetical protein Q4P29_01615 [Tissierellia bacterium]|nr:hypothetical protein [Tissierellia bacterium]